MKNKKQIAIKSATISILGNFSLAVIKGITGFFGNSYALIADAIESMTDVFSSFLVLFGLKYSTKPPDENHPYGHGKIEPLVTFLVVFSLIISAVIIAHQSIENIKTPHTSPAPYTLIILGVIIVVKELFYRYISKKSNETKSTSLKADAWHHRSDAITSLVAFIGIAIAIIMGKGYENADDWAALIASGFIIFNAFLIFRPALGEIMDEHIHHDMEEDIRKISKSVSGVIDTEKCYIRKSGLTYQVDLHMIVDKDISVLKGHDISHHLKDELLRQLPEISNVIIHVEPTK